MECHIVKAFGHNLLLGKHKEFAYMQSAFDRIKPSRETILVAGTGLSMSLTDGKVPQLSWIGLIRSGFQYATEIGTITQERADSWTSILDGSPTTAEILNVAGFLSSSLRAGEGFDYGKWLRREFGDVEVSNKNLAETIKSASDAGVKLCTLNYDSLLESITDLPPIYMGESDQVIEWIQGKSKGILHLHGHWKKPETCILSNQDYQEAIKSSPRLFFQQHLTVLEKLVFVGCGGTFEDPNFDKTLSWLRDELGSTSLQTFALVKDSDVARRKADKAWKNIVEPVGFGEDNANLGPFLADLFQETISKSIESYPDLLGTLPIRSLQQGQNTADLDCIQSQLAPAPQAKDIRHAQSFESQKILQSNRRLWLVADWGMGEDEFISAAILRTSGKAAKVYSVNISNFTDKASFCSHIEELLGAPFDAFCNSLSAVENPHLILRDAPLDNAEEKEKIQSELLSLTDILISFCDNLRVIITSRGTPDWSGETVEITALDAADTRTYIESHPQYRGSLSNRHFTQLYEYTNGVPRIIREAIDKLSVATLEEIIGERASTRLTMNGRFVESIRSLSSAQEIERKYAFSLLKSLSAFPYGEYLENIKRIDSSKRYTIEHAVILQREGFIYVEDQDTFGHTGSRESRKRLTVTRPVRQWLIQEMTSHEVEKLKKQAYQLYFGQSWQTLSPKLNHIFKANDFSEKSSEINNAKYFIVDIFAQGRTNERWRTIAIELASQFCATVSKKSYYKVVHDLFVAVRPMLDDVEKDHKYWFLMFLFAKAIRMIGDRATKDEALNLLLDCEKHIDQRKLLASIKLKIAMIYDSRKESAEATRYAKQAKKLGVGSVAMQASVIELRYSESASKDAEISKIQAKAKTKASAVYSNIALERADLLDEDAAKVSMLSDLVDYCHKNKDLYNQIRATLTYVGSRLAVSGELEERDISSLISIYHHLHHEDMPVLHATCHRLLWSAFELNADYPNMLQLFKYSSLYWRLRDEQDKELKALQKFKLLNLPTSLPGRDPAVLYYYGRLESIDS